MIPAGQNLGLGLANPGIPSGGPASSLRFISDIPKVNSLIHIPDEILAIFQLATKSLSAMFHCQSEMRSQTRANVYQMLSTWSAMRRSFGRDASSTDEDEDEDESSDR